jgi:hypothetical protein
MKADLFQYLRIHTVKNKPPNLLKLRNSFCFPLHSHNPQQFKFYGGLYRQDGSYIPSSGLVTGGKVVVGGDKLPEGTIAKIITGKSLYLGVCHYHFGHFLVETLSRLWFLNPKEITEFDHIILLPLNNHIPHFVYDLFDLLGVANRIFVVEEPVLLENVWLPEPAIVYPTIVHQHIKNIWLLFADLTETKKSQQPLYISRTLLSPGHHRVIIGENYLEAALARQGIRIYHPQLHSIANQISTLSEHQTIVGFAGSALHSLILAGGRKKIITYSNRPIPQVFLLLDKVMDNQANYINARRKSLTGLASMATGFAPQLIDPRIILKALKKQKLISDSRIDDYGTQESDTTEVKKFNTALILRRILEISSIKNKPDCFAEITNFKNIYPLDEDMLEHARQSSELLRQYF